MQYQQPEPPLPKPTLYAVEGDAIPTDPDPDFAFAFDGEVFFVSLEAAKRFANGKEVRVIAPCAKAHSALAGG